MITSDSDSAKDNAKVFKRMDFTKLKADKGKRFERVTQRVLNRLSANKQDKVTLDLLMGILTSRQRQIA